MVTQPTSHTPGQKMAGLSLLMEQNIHSPQRAPFISVIQEEQKQDSTHARCPTLPGKQQFQQL
ncbi:hypothetical protein HOLleu_22118 [Holothuria leucospilota]|uniref:Uncharacterized protein n=1 Tax=Holothuria leucospilota TaxID=206669 RepID=A0A9Q1H6X9_HOLLE|nr:hypothetical protein HOLleu_22118 [Holothuria leucospilota]